MTADAPSGPPATIRRLTGVDVVAYRFVRLESLRVAPDAYGSAFADWAKRPNSAFLERIEAAAIFGAFTAHGLEGLMACDREKGGRADHRALIHQVYVRDTLRRRGTARALLSACIDWARAAGVLQLELMVADDNVAAVALYIGAGFRTVGVLPRALKRKDGDFADERMMVLALDALDALDAPVDASLDAPT